MQRNNACRTRSRDQGLNLMPSSKIEVDLMRDLQGDAEPSRHYSRSIHSSSTQQIPRFLTICSIRSQRCYEAMYRYHILYRPARLLSCTAAAAEPGSLLRSRSAAAAAGKVIEHSTCDNHRCASPGHLAALSALRQQDQTSSNVNTYDSMCW